MSTFFDALPISLEQTAPVNAVFLDSHGLRACIAKERLRSDRHGRHFALIAIRLVVNEKSDTSRKIDSLRDILETRLRITDERGLDQDGSIVVLLPETGYEGGMVVVDSLVSLAAREEIYFHAQVHLYPGGSNSQFTDSDSVTADKLDTGREDLAQGDGVGFNGVRNQSMESKIAVHCSRGLYAPDSRGLIAQPFPAWKRIMDLLFAAAGLIVASPVLLAAATAIKATSKGPVLFRQWRTGQNGRPFSIMKFRTMVVDAEELKDKLRRMNERDGPAFKMKDDPRVTLVGKLLRSTGLDELPQLWNVFRGEMSIVGPRPLPVDEDALCQQWHRRRLDTKPGITCLWQISKSRKISFDDWMRMDIQYASTRSLKRDVSLMLRTVAAVVLGRVGH